MALPAVRGVIFQSDKAMYNTNVQHQYMKTTQNPILSNNHAKLPLTTPTCMRGVQRKANALHWDVLAPSQLYSLNGIEMNNHRMLVNHLWHPLSKQREATAHTPARFRGLSSEVKQNVH